MRRLQVVLAHVNVLIAAGVQPSDIGVITPYNAQVTFPHRDRQMLHNMAHAGRAGG